MAVSNLSSSKLKKALTEALVENPGLLREVVSEVLEDIGMAEAMRRAKKSGRVSRDQVLKVLRNEK